MSNTQSILSVTSLFAFFYEELSNALRITGTTTTQETEAYLVRLLEGFVTLNDQQVAEIGFDRPAAHLLEEAMNAEGAQRVEAYRRLGDNSLYSCGFFDKKLKQSVVGARYYAEMGRTAYLSLYEMMRLRQPGGVFQIVFEELYHKFDQVVAAFQLLGMGTRQDALLDHWSEGKIDDDSLLRAGLWVSKTTGVS